MAMNVRIIWIPWRPVVARRSTITSLAWNSLLALDAIDTNWPLGSRLSRVPRRTNGSWWTTFTVWTWWSCQPKFAMRAHWTLPSRKTPDALRSGTSDWPWSTHYPRRAIVSVVPRCTLRSPKTIEPISGIFPSSSIGTSLTTIAQGTKVARCSPITWLSVKSWQSVHPGRAFKPSITWGPVKTLMD